ncbi:MAG: hypothetical protein IJ221_07190 [Oscillibacter sp.]|nr:hypothetical protein [Oscillibacter sp.]
MAKYLDSAGLGYFWSKLKALLAAKADAEEVAERVAGTQSGTTGAWTGVSAAGSLRDGKEILYYLPYAGSGSATLNLTLSTGKTTGAKAVYRYGTTRVTTQYPAGSWVRLTYVAEKNGWYADADYDANTYDRVRWNNAVTAASAVAANTLIGGTAEGYRTLTGGVSFDLGYPLLYATAAIAAGTTATTAYLTYPSAYTANNKSGFTGPVGRTVYLVGTVQGRRFTVDTSVFTASVPVEEDGRFYLPVGLLYSANRMYFCGGVSAQAYAFVDGAFRPASWDPTVPPWARAAEKPAYTKEEVGLGKVENKSSAEIRGELTKSDVTAALGYTPLQSVGAHTHTVSDIAQGDAATAGGLDPVTQGLIGSAASNKSFHLPAGAITVEYSTDGGAAWQDYGATDAQKVGLFSETRGTNFYLGKASAKAANTTACRLRITIEPTDRYVSFNGVYLWISTSGSTVYMDLERSTIGAKETYTTVFTGQRLSGWSGNNIRYFPQGQFGGGATQTGNFYKYRLTLYQTAVNASYAAASVSDIRFLGVNVWNSPNNVVGTNRLYRWDTDLNATFPAQLTATAFNGPLNGKATSAGTADSAATAAKIAPFEKATASANRSVWFADSAAVNKPVYSDKFKYDPAADVLTVGSITGKAASADTLTGLTASVTELNHTKGVTSAIQTQLDGKAGTAEATQSAKGLLSADDKKKIDGIESGAQKNTVTGVKGSAETAYRTGNVSLTAANVGAAAASHTHDPSSITAGYLDARVYYNTHPESGGGILPFLYNDLAFLTLKGGSCSYYTTTATSYTAASLSGTTAISTSLVNCFDGSPSYASPNRAVGDVCVIDLTLHKMFAYSNVFYIDFGAPSWRAKSITILVRNKDTESAFTQKGAITGNARGHWYQAVSHTSTNASGATVQGFNQLRIVLTDFNSSSNRIAQIGLINYGSAGVNETFISRGGCAGIYGSLVPHSDGSIDLGSSAKKWKTVYASTFSGKATSAGTADALKDVTATAAELNYTAGVTSAIQTQLDGKAASSHTHTSAQVSDRLNVTGKGNYAWVSAANDDKLITSNTLAYWSGAYNGTSSNLTYCVKGAFGDLAAISKPTSNGTTTFLRGDGTWAVPAGTSYSNATQSAAGLMSADDKKIVDGIATTYLPKTTYEFNKEIAFGSSGKLCIGKFPCYDSNVTIEINATTNTTYHATAVLATQNINESHGGTITWNVYGDASNTIAPNLYLYYPSDSRYIEIYFSPSTYSKNLVHIQCQALRAAPTNVCESITAIPSTATTKPVNALGGYVKGLSASGKVITYTKGDGTTGTISTQDTTYNAATQSAAGLMSADDKKKLDGITIANYLPLSGGTLTGNLTGKYITGTWLQGTASNHASNQLDKVVVQDGSGWLYHRTLSEMKSDLGVAMPNGTANVGSGLLGVLDLIRYAWGGVDGVYTAEYVGTGTYGASNPCTIAEADLSREYETNGTSEYVGDALDGKSYRVVYAAVVYDTTDNGVLFLFPSFSAQDPTGRGFSITGSTITWATVTNFKYRKGAASYWPITWYSTSALRQMNVKDHQYRVLLLGFDRLQAMAWKAYTLFGRLQSDG